MHQLPGWPFVNVLDMGGDRHGHGGAKARASTDCGEERYEKLLSAG